jgi:predicted Zn-dependent protease
MTRPLLLALLLAGCAGQQAAQYALLKGAIEDLEREDYARAQLKLEEGVRNEPRNAEMCSRLADLYTRDGKYDEAVRVLRACGNADNADVQESLGMALYKSQSPPSDAAIAALERAVAINGNAVAARMLLGRHYAESDPCKAADHLEASIGVLDEDHETRVSALVALMRCGRWPAAERHAELLMRVAPNHAYSMVFLAGARMAREKWSQAALLYQILTQDPDHPPAHDLNLARCYAKLERWADARRVLDGYLRQKPEDPQALELRSEIARHRP